MNKKIIKNFIYNSLLKLSSVIFPLLTLPYITRNFSIETLGKISFIQSFVSYFISFSSLGLPIYGIREIAKLKDNKTKRNKVLIELTFLNLLITIVGCIVILIMAYFSSKLIEVRNLLFIYTLNLIASPFLLDWYYSGMEKYSVITKRTLTTRTLSLILLYLFIKNDTDISNYIWLLTIPNLVISLYNIFYIKTKYDIYIPKIKNLKKHFKEITYSFLLLLSILVFSTLDTVILGFYSTRQDVAFYSIASKLVRISLTLILAYGTVLIPEITRSIEAKDLEKYKKITKNSLSVSLILMIPTFVGFFFFSEEILTLVFGQKYIEAKYVLRIFSFLALFVTISNFCGMQILYPNKQDKIVLKTVVIGALLNIILNILLVKSYGAIGVAISTVFADAIIAVLQLYFSLKYIEFKIKDIRFFRYLFAAIIISFLSKKIFNENYLKLIFYSLSYLGVFILLEWKEMKVILKRG